MFGVFEFDRPELHDLLDEGEPMPAPRGVADAFQHGPIRWYDWVFIKSECAWVVSSKTSRFELFVYWDKERYAIVFENFSGKEREFRKLCVALCSELAKK